MEANTDHRVGFFVALVAFIYNSANFLISISNNIIRPTNAEMQ